MTESLGRRMKDLLLEEMVGSLPGARDASTWRALVLDPLTTKVLSSALKMSEMQALGISHVEDLTKVRQPLGLEAIYFISPTDSSVDLLVSDFAREKPLYPAAHVFFSSKLSSALLGKIKGCKKLVSNLKALKETNLEVVALDSRAFDTAQPDALQKFFGEGVDDISPDYREEMKTMVSRLSTVCTTLKEFPAIRYRIPTGLNSSSTLASSIAFALEEKLTECQRAGAVPKTNTCELLILDRGYDPVAPVIHEWTYEAMVYDLFDIDGNVYKPPKTDDTVSAKEVVLGEHDELWRELRHLHIAEASSQVNAKMEDFRAKNVAARLGKSGASQVSNTDMRKLIQALPEYRDFISRLSLHIDITSELFQATNARKLKEMGELEQDVVYGDKHSKDIMTWLQANKDAKPIDKMRLFMCYLATHPDKVDTDRRRQWQNTAQLRPEEMNTILHLEQLGVSITKKDGSSLLSFGKKKKKATRKERESDKLSQQYALARFQPLLVDLLESLVAGTLSTEAFPYVRPPTKEGSTGTTAGVASVRSNTSTFSWARKQKDSTKPEVASGGQQSAPRLIVFVIGGITRSEMRVVHKLSESLNYDIVIGGTSAETPKSFINRLANLGNLSADMVAVDMDDA
ncbi:hypothetical protein BSKO_14066 [Bryopsis sp. KO-2023]|nr:hypothetical protein BSKO_14066 [Bryopsis sp. KO-2023]